VALGPAEVHPQQHLRPVGGFRAAGTRADRDDGVLRVELAIEQEEGPLALELGLQGAGLALDIGLGLRIGGVGEEVQELGQVIGPLLERAPQGDLVAQALGLAGDLLGGALVVPEPGFDRAGVELRDAGLLGGQVKDAPRSTGSALPGP
jgi:hypothetical protein